MNDHNILQCAIHMVHGWSLPPNTCKRERKIARIISRRIKRDDIYEKLQMLQMRCMRCHAIFLSIG